ncbi:hypothetical protein ACFOD4_13710 [Pseudoroseomonas globiformis]|uniref:SGNH/GDSL hydrolase family protein n=1 Tax=Teichococcus globiformis TaxID=2307229 RepID=A0ABV7G0E6_9PROT
MLERLSQLIDPMMLAVLLTQLVAIGLGFWLVRRRLHGLWRTSAFALLGLLALRVALFGNPVAWGAYYVALQGHADWRQTDVIAERFRSLMPARPGAEFLAIGSSQTFAIYREITRGRDDLQLFSLAGMTPMDMMLYRDRILALRPQHVLLYISEFDLAAELRPEWARLAPVPLLRIPDQVAALRAALPSDALPDLQRDLVLGALLPEYRYNFVFRDILSRSASLAGLPGFRPQRGADDAVNYAALTARATQPMEGMSRLLEAFIGSLREAGIGTVLVEGQYNPHGETPGLLQQHRAFGAYLSALQQRHPDLLILRRDELPLLSSGDFDDAYHLSPAAGHRMAEAVLQAARHRLGQATAISRLEAPPR